MEHAVLAGRAAAGLPVPRGRADRGHRTGRERGPALRAAGAGYFAVEISWLARPATIRIAVADGGGPAGMCGDERGRLVWADVRWDTDDQREPGFPDRYRAALRDVQAVLAARYPEAAIWFGQATMHWWATVGDPAGAPDSRLLTAGSPLELARLLGLRRARQWLVRRPSRGPHGATGRRRGSTGSRPAIGPARGPPLPPAAGCPSARWAWPRPGCRAGRPGCPGCRGCQAGCRGCRAAPGWPRGRWLVRRPAELLPAEQVGHCRAERLGVLVDVGPGGHW